MKSYAESKWKQRCVFFLAGLVVAGICTAIQMYWMEIIPYATFDSQPKWLQYTKRFIGWLPWILLFLLLILRIAMGQRIRIGFYLFGAIVPMAFVIGHLLLGDVIANYTHRQKFDAASWLNHEQIEHDIMWPPRLCMVDNLISSGQLNGLTSNQVVELLGPPENKGYPGGAKLCDIHYHLGPGRTFIRIDDEWLFITFDEKGIVNKYWLYID